MKIFTKELRALFGLSLGHFNIDLYAALLTPLYPLITTKLGISLAYVSSVIALGHLVSSMLQPVFGFISDKLRHRFFMVWGLVLSSIFIPLTIKTNTVRVFMAFLMLGMIGNAFFHPQVSALIKDFNKNNPDLSRVMGIFLGLGTIGYAIGPYLATFLVDNYGQNSLLYLAFLGLFSALFLYFFVPKKSEESPVAKENFFEIMKEILKDKTSVFLTFISTIKSAVSISFGTFVPFLLKESGFSLKAIGLIVTLFFIAGGSATIISSKIEKYFKANGTVVLSFIGILPSILLFLYLINKNNFYLRGLAIICFILSGFFIMLSVGIILVQAQKAIPKYTGVISGVMQGFSWGLGALFLSPLGMVAQNFGIEKVYILMGIVTFFVGIYAYKLNLLKD